MTNPFIVSIYILSIYSLWDSQWVSIKEADLEKSLTRVVCRACYTQCHLVCAI